jgi:acetylornithine deacetylase
MVLGQTRAIIGEPTMLNVVYATKGTLLITARAQGKSAHSSSARGVNANMSMIPFLMEAKRIHDETITDAKWQNDLFDPPVMSMNIGVNDFNRAVNVTARKSICTIYLRPMPGVDFQPLIDRLQYVADQHEIKMKVDERGKPLMVDPESDFVQTALRLTHVTQPQTVCYGTDGGVLTELNEKIVLGPGNIEQAHTINEWIAIEQLSLGTEVYAKFIREFCCQ